MPRNPKILTAKSLRSKIALLQKQIDAKQEKITKYKNEIDTIKAEIRKLNRDADKLARAEAADKIYALSMKYHIPVDEMIEMFTFLNSLKTNPEYVDTKLHLLREHYRQSGNEFCLKWLDAVENMIQTE